MGRSPSSCIRREEVDIDLHAGHQRGGVGDVDEDLHDARRLRAPAAARRGLRRDQRRGNRRDPASARPRRGFPSGRAPPGRRTPAPCCARRGPRARAAGTRSASTASGRSRPVPADLAGAHRRCRTVPANGARTLVFSNSGLGPGEVGAGDGEGDVARIRRLGGRGLAAGEVIARGLEPAQSLGDLLARFGEGSRMCPLRSEAVVTAPGRGQSPLSVGGAVLRLAQVRQDAPRRGTASRSCLRRIDLGFRGSEACAGFLVLEARR